MPHPYIMVCSTCGSDEILFSSESTWNPVTQEMDYYAREDYGDRCMKCEDTVEVENIDITDVKLLAQIAIHQSEVA